jgi:hypothetical protein
MKSLKFSISSSKRTLNFRIEFFKSKYERSIGGVLKHMMKVQNWTSNLHLVVPDTLQIENIWNLKLLCRSSSPKVILNLLYFMFFFIDQVTVIKIVDVHDS